MFGCLVLGLASQHAAGAVITRWNFNVNAPGTDLQRLSDLIAKMSDADFAGRVDADDEI